MSGGPDAEGDGIAVDDRIAKEILDRIQKKDRRGVVSLLLLGATQVAEGRLSYVGDTYVRLYQERAYESGMEISVGYAEIAAIREIG